MLRRCAPSLRSWAAGHGARRAAPARWIRVGQVPQAEWGVSASQASLRVSNPIREIVDQIDLSKINARKDLIPLSIGDPTKFGNMDTDRGVTGAIISNVNSASFNGYPPSDGYLEAREAVASYHSTDNTPLTASDVVITSGCSHALQLCIEVLCDPGDEVLVPRPGFPLYRTICDYLQIKSPEYDLLPDKDWEVDIAHMESLITPRTKAILVNNPSNPCGSVFSRQHLQDILEVAERHAIPIIADEIYGEMAFQGSEFDQMATITSTVPILSTGGIAKRFLVPGWRVGWILIQDKNDVLTNGGIREGLNRLTQIIVGCNSLVQSALPSMLHRTKRDFFENTMKTLQTHAEFTVEALSEVPGLRPVSPQGAMYVMVALDVEQFDGIKDDLTFSQMLLAEESVFVLPGQCFGTPNYFRIVTCPPLNKLGAAYDRIKSFCSRHHNDTKSLES